MTTDSIWISQAIDFCLQVTHRNLETLTCFPERTAGGEWLYAEDGGRVGGHWVGILWLACGYTGDIAFERAARQWASRLAPRHYDTTTHDLGFLFELSHVLGHRLTGDESLKTPAVSAANTLCQRFNENGEFFQAWGPLDAPPEVRGRTIIDTMMNLDLLFWASKQTNDPNFGRRAAAHARTCQTHHLRLDHSTAHVVDFDPQSGQFLQQATHQGLSPNSCWSRGQSWAVYGFVDCYRATHDPIFLDTAHNLAEYALNNLPPDLVPYWDYRSPEIPNDVRDSSAASILSSALLNLADLESSSDKAVYWRSQAEAILKSLWENYSSRGAAEPSILIHGTRSKPHGLMDHGLIYGDYYFLEALLHCTG